MRPLPAGMREKVPTTARLFADFGVAARKMEELADDGVRFVLGGVSA